MRRTIAVLLSILILSFSVVSFVKGSTIYWKNESQVHKGVLNLEKVDIEKLGIIQLNGEWEFYKNEFISPQSFQKEGHRKTYIPVPHIWDRYFPSSGDKIETGTYRLMIRVPKEGKYGIKANSIRHASRVYINGVEVGGLGTPSANVRQYHYREGKYVAFANSKHKTLEIVIYVANRLYPNGGIVKPILFGSEETIMLSNERSQLFDGIIVGGYLLLAILFFFYYIQHKRAADELYFAIFSLFQSVYVSTQNEKLIYLFFPRIPNEVLLSVQLSFISLSALFFLLFIHEMFRLKSNRRMTKWIEVMLGVQAVFFGIPSAVNYTYSFVPVKFYQVLLVMTIGVAFLYIFSILVRAFISRMKGAEYLLVAATSFTCYVLALSIELLVEIDIGQISLFLFLLMNVSLSFFIGFRRQLAYEKIDDLSKELLVQHQLKDDFLLKASQELKKPLSEIIHSSKILMEGMEGPLKKKQQDLVFLVHYSGKRLEHLVNDLQSARSENLPFHFRFKPVQLDMVNDMVFELSLFIKNPQELSIENQIRPDLPDVWADENSFKQILFHLLQNAIKYTNTGKIIVSAAVKGDKLEISVSDTGIGIEEQFLERIFDTFFQVPNQQNQHGDGLGLGLSITKKFVTLMGGEIWATSTPGKGTSFTFTLPVYEGNGFEGLIDPKLPSDISKISEEAVQNMVFPKKIQGFGADPKNILLIDEDSRYLVEMLKILAKSGYSVVACNTSEDALKIVKEESVDLAVMDVKLPMISGFELSKKIREKYDRMELPILMLTTSSETNDTLLLFQIGANDVIQKPSTQQEFLSKIQSLLAMREAVLQSVFHELKYYYAQITPHFLYNTLNTIIGLSYQDAGQTREALEHLAVYFRSKLDFQKQHSLIPLDDEVELVQSYLAIEKLRFGKQLTIYYDIDETIQIMVPAMTIQPLVENAIQHGLAKKKEAATLKLSIQREEGFIKIIIEDNGVGIPEAKQSQLLHGYSQRIGFMNPFEKLKLMKNSSFQLFSKEGKGTRIIITLPDEERKDRES